MDENLGDRRQNTPSNNRNVVPIVIGVCVLIVVAVLGICVYLITAGNILPREVSQRLSEIEAALESFKTDENTSTSEDYESILQDIQELKDNMGNLVGNQSEKVNEKLEELLGKLEEYKPETDNENVDTTPDVGGTGSPEDLAGRQLWTT
jgi:predicted PurR-regulated permease PerM